MRGLKSGMTRRKVLQLGAAATAGAATAAGIAASLRPGYERDGRVLRPEMVAVYVYEPAGGEVEARSGNE